MATRHMMPIEASQYGLIVVASFLTTTSIRSRTIAETVVIATTRGDERRAATTIARRKMVGNWRGAATSNLMMLAPSNVKPIIATVAASYDKIRVRKSDPARVTLSTLHSCPKSSEKHTFQPLVEGARR